MCKEKNKIELEEVEKKIIKHLDKETEIVTVVEGEFSFETRDITNQFQFIELARLEEKGVLYSNLSEHKDNAKVRKYFLTKLGMELLIKINKEEGAKKMGKSILKQVIELSNSVELGKRDNWDEYFIAQAYMVAMRATCSSRRVGAVIVRDKRIIATGYNGFPSGGTHRVDGGCARFSAIKEGKMKKGEYKTEFPCFAIHAFCSPS